jgi:hypothetical protein
LLKDHGLPLIEVANTGKRHGEFGKARKESGEDDASEDGEDAFKLKWNVSVSSGGITDLVLPYNKEPLPASHSTHTAHV